MVTMYKLVSQDMTTRGGMKWEIGKTNRANAVGTRMCTNQVLHCYNDPRLAIIFNPIHAGITDPILLQIECSTIVNSDKLKFACKEQTPKCRLPLPEVSLTQKVAFAVKCALTVHKASEFVLWAENWLSGVDRSSRAAIAAHAAATAAYADTAANATAAYAAYAAAYDADTAAYAANAAAHAADISFVDIITWVMENIT